MSYVEILEFVRDPVLLIRKIVHHETMGVSVRVDLYQNSAEDVVEDTFDVIFST